MTRGGRSTSGVTVVDSRSRSAFCLFSLFILISVSAQGRAAWANLVADGGFEEGEAFALSSHWSIRAEEQRAVLRDTAHLRNGHASLCLRHRKSTSYSWARQNRIHVPPGAKLIIRCWARGEDLEKGDGSAGARLYLEDPVSAQQIASLTLPSGTFKWKEFKLGPVPMGNRKSVNVILYLHKCTGTVWFDDMSVTVETPDEQSRRRRAPLRNLLYADVQTVRGHLDSPRLRERLTQIEIRVDGTAQFTDQLDFLRGPPYTPLQGQIYSLLGSHLAAHGQPRLAVAPANPWRPFSPLSLPRELPSTGIAVLMARGEREQVSLNLTACWSGPGRSPLAVRIHPEPLPGMRLLQVTHVLLRDGRIVPDPLSPLAHRDANAWQMHIHPGQTRQLWIDIDSASLSPGMHRRTIELSVQDPPHTVRVPLGIRVLPIRMPEDMPLASYTYWWDYDASGTELDMRMMEQYHVNTVFVKVRPRRHPFWDAEGVPFDQDFSNITRNRAMRKAHRVIVWMIAVKWARLDDLKDPTAVKGYRAWMRMVLKEFERAGVPRDKLLFYLVDEPHGADAAALVAGLGEIIHDIDPSLNIWANPYHHTSREDLAVMAPEIGVWAPNSNWLSAAPENLSFFRRGGREVWTYAPIGRGSDALDEYRMMFWRALRWDLKGVGFFSWNYRSGRVWNDFDGEYGDWSVVYEPVPWASGRTTSKRWEAWREGAEDAMLHFALSQASSATKGRATAESRQWLRSIPKRVTSAMPESRPDVILKAREEMLKALAGLEN